MVLKRSWHEAMRERASAAAGGRHNGNGRAGGALSNSASGCSGRGSPREGLSASWRFVGDPRCRECEPFLPAERVLRAEHLVDFSVGTVAFAHGLRVKGPRTYY